MARTGADPFVEQVRSANDIVDIVGAQVALTRAGIRLKGLCPFHQEKTPSFHVSPDHQTYHCFGCGAGGDVFSFVMELENMTFPEALRHLA
ncbi:MAG: CHC2 zinc finger domain-containing protein [Candidatus Eisenbacteria bacterium]